MSTNSSDPSTWDPSTWAPPGESSFDILNDAVNLAGSTTVCGFSYGVAFTLYCICARILYFERRHPERRKRRLFLLVYTTILVICGGIYVASSARVAQLAYVNNRNYPAGPAAYTSLLILSPDSVVGTAAYFVVNWMTDAIVIWRLYILWSAKRYALAIVALPCMLYVASFSMSILLVIGFETFRMAQLWWPITLAYYVMTASLTIIATILMTLRLLRARSQYIQAMGNSNHAKQYLSIAAMLIESSALYSVWSIIFIGLFIVNHPIQSVFLSTLTSVQIIALLLIIYRVSQGKAWESNTELTLSTMRWASSCGPRSTNHVGPAYQSRDDSSATRCELSSAVAADTSTVDVNKTRAEA